MKSVGWSEIKTHQRQEDNESCPRPTNSSFSSATQPRQATASSSTSAAVEVSTVSLAQSSSIQGALANKGQWHSTDYCSVVAHAELHPQIGLLLISSRAAETEQRQDTSGAGDNNKITINRRGRSPTDNKTYNEDNKNNSNNNATTELLSPVLVVVA